MWKHTHTKPYLSNTYVNRPPRHECNVTEDEIEHVSAKLTDIERIERWNALVADHDGAKSELVKEIIDDAYEARDLEGAPDPVEDEAGDEGHWYDPTEDIDEPLDGEDLRDILWAHDNPAVNPGHIKGRQIPVKNQAETADVLAAIGRYHGIDATRDEVDWLIETTIGKGRDNHNLRTYRSRVLKRLRDEDTSADNVPIAPRVSKSVKAGHEGDDEWLEKTREVVDDDDLPPAVLENRLEDGREMMEVADDDHPRYDEFEEAVEQLEAAIEAREDDE